MTSDVRFERLVEKVLDESAPAAAPDELISAVLAATHDARRWPAWLARSALIFSCSATFSARCASSIGIFDSMYFCCSSTTSLPLVAGPASSAIAATLPRSRPASSIATSAPSL